MIIPIPVRIANILMVQSKYSHDWAIDIITSTTECVYEHSEIPHPIRQLALALVGNAVMLGDDIGNMMVQLYIMIVQWCHP